MALRTRPVSWLGSALKEFERFPEGVQLTCLAALTIAAEGGKADIARPMDFLGPGVFEIQQPFRGVVYRVVYAAQPGAELWVVCVVQKKSKPGVKTSSGGANLIRERLKRLKEMLS